MTWIIGCDPGMDGAVALIPVGEGVPENTLHVIDIERTADERSIDIDGLRTKIFNQIPDLCAPLVILLEEVNAVPKFGSVASFKLGRAVGMLEAMFILMKPARYLTIKPRAWKTFHGLIRDKKMSEAQKKRVDLEYARKYFGPFVTSQFLSCAKDHNRADALLIAEYGRRNHLGQGL